IRAFARINDGFKLAELDLELRGPGAIYGKTQHGALDLRFASLSDHKLIRDVREAVKIFKDSYILDDFKELSKRVRLAQAVITLN
ncbi:ATP-dependent DNA helicase RecG, partial [Candidatus Saccharibacteria bacterium]|nr:ATP-dependent DNA helicase RecG [Candidatus Saccharibacteria bacterium]